MSTTVESEQLFCANCSDPVDVVDEAHYGRCCQNLPAIWGQGSDGLFTRRMDQGEPEDNHTEDEDNEDEDRRPVCPNCGATRFVIRAREWRQVALTTTATGLNEDYDDATLWYDHGDFDDDGTVDSGNFEIDQVVCGACRCNVIDDVTIGQV